MTAHTGLVEEVDRSLDDLRQGLKQDGYDFHVGVGADGELQVALVAEPDACEDCLVPKDVMVTILESTLPAAAQSQGWHLAYPSDF